MVAGKQDPGGRRDGGGARRAKPESRRGDSAKRYPPAVKRALLDEYETDR